MTHDRAGRSTTPFCKIFISKFLSKVEAANCSWPRDPTLLSHPLSAVDPMQVLKVAHSQLFIRLASCQSLRSSNATFTAVDTLDLNRIGFLSFCCSFFYCSFSLRFRFFLFFCALIPSILWIFLSMQGRRRQKFTCKVASCDNDRKKATAQGGGLPQKKCQDVAAGWGCMTLCLWCVSECVCVLSVATLARTLCPCRRLSQFVTEVSVGAGDKKLLTWYESKMRRYWWPRQLQTMQSVSLVLFFLFQ